MAFASLTIDAFLDRLASADPTPGGGALAPMAAAFAAAMVSMVCNLTLGRPRFADVQDAVVEILDQATASRGRLLALTDADSDAYGAVSQAYRLPRATAEQQATRAGAIETSMHGATEVPVESAEEARALLSLTLRIAEVGNPTLLSDVAVAAHIAAAAVRAAAAQADFNIATLTDREFAASMQDRLDRARVDLDGLTARILDVVSTRAAAP